MEKEKITRTRFVIKAKNNRLGQGLDALLGSSKGDDQVLLLDIEKLQPNKRQPRTVFNRENLEKLSDSIKENGILQPILVQRKNESYVIIAGERRWRAACRAGLRKVPVIVRRPQAQQAELWALIENVQREDLSPIEEARAFKKIMNEGHLSQEALAKNLGRSRSSLANSLRLLSLDKQVQELVSAKKISFAQARELLRFKSPKVQRKMALDCLKKELTVRQLGQKANKKKALDSSLPFWLKKALLNLERRFSKKLQLDYSKGKGRLIFSFQKESELKDILDKLWN